MRDGLRVVALGIAMAGAAGCTSVPGLNNNETATSVTAVTGFDSARRGGSTTGVRDDSVCEGWYPEAPNHIVEIEDAMAMTIRGTSGDDLRIWMRGGQSNFCSTGATVQEYMRFWNRGTVEVYVGTLEQAEQIEYVLEFEEN